MAGFLGPDEVRRVKESVDIVDLMADYTTLKQSGTNYSGCCPFHHERTPSMHIYTDDQHYHCFGCGVNGDVITLITEKEGLDFMGAVEWIARRGGVELVYEKGTKESTVDRSQREQYLAIMEAATVFYEYELWETENGSEARDYLQERGLSVEVCKAFRLGWAPGKKGFCEVETQNFKRKDLIDLDVGAEREHNGQTFFGDRFYQRLMFPIADRFGQVIAFSGRIMPRAERAAKERGQGVGKYINSRDTPLYHKSNVVFNLHQARPQARAKKRVIIMEGPTDVMAAHQEGMSECVAVLGTALTPEHAKQIHRSVGQDGRLIMLFDGDSAGQTNSVKAVRTCMTAGVSCQAAVLPDGKDPAELLQDGVAALDTVLLKPTADIDYVLRYLAPRPYELDSRQQLSVIDKLLGVFREMKDHDLRDGFLQDAADYLNIDAHKLERRMNSSEQHQPRYSEAAVDDDEMIEELPRLSQEQDRIFVILLTQPSLRSVAFDEFGCEPHLFPLPWRRMVEALVDDGDMEREAILSHECLQFDGELRSEVSRLIHHNKDSDITRHDLEEVMQQLQRSQDENAMRQLEFKLQEAQRNGNQDDSRELFKELLAMQQNMRRP